MVGTLPAPVVVLGSLLLSSPPPRTMKRTTAATTKTTPISAVLVFMLCSFRARAARIQIAWFLLHDIGEKGTATCRIGIRRGAAAGVGRARGRSAGRRRARRRAAASAGRDGDRRRGC